MRAAGSLSQSRGCRNSLKTGELWGWRRESCDLARLAGAVLRLPSTVLLENNRLEGEMLYGGTTERDPPLLRIVGTVAGQAAGEERERWLQERGLSCPALAESSRAHSSALTSKVVAAYTEPSSLGNPCRLERWQQLFAAVPQLCWVLAALLALPLWERCPLPRYGSQGMCCGYVTLLSPTCCSQIPSRRFMLASFLPALCPVRRAELRGISECL